VFRYHGGALLTGKIAVNLIWYGEFTPRQRGIVSDFILSISETAAAAGKKPNVGEWWSYVERYRELVRKYRSSSLSLYLGKEISDEYSIGKSLSQDQIVELAGKGDHKYAINVVLTAADVTVDGFCLSRCGTHGYENAVVGGRDYKYAYIWVGNSAAQCPGYCAWPFHRPIPGTGPQNPPLVAPNGDVGLDGVVMNLAALLAGTATDPFGNGFYQGSPEAPLEAATACAGVYGKGAYPGYPGELLVDPTTGASYNAEGVGGRKYLLPAIFDPKTSTCSTL
ncbi:hypothetical protein M569_02363, partial [Genlisea aurea]